MSLPSGSLSVKAGASSPTLFARSAAPDALSSAVARCMVSITEYGTYTAACRLEVGFERVEFGLKAHQVAPLA